ncbi:MAG: exodeoxyribonuclease VII small subunit [Candidatus Saccharimonadales bacterium]
MSAKNEPSLSEQIKQLDELAMWFEQDDFDIEEAITKFEEASKVADAVQVKLSDLENKITVLKERFDVAA